MQLKHFLISLQRYKISIINLLRICEIFIAFLIFLISSQLVGGFLMLPGEFFFPHMEVNFG